LPLIVSQLISSLPLSFSALLHRLKQSLPMNGLAVFVAPSGLGWLHMMTVCLLALTLSHILAAGLPQHRNTIPSLSLLSVLIVALVISSHPFFWCEFALPPWTVSTALSMKTPCAAHVMRYPFSGFLEMHLVVRSSLKMFRRLRKLHTCV